MLRILIPLLSLSLSTSALYNFDFYPAVASDAQIRFAIENRYDDTGPGAKKPEYAYNTYKALEDALLGYLDDPDTKLPKGEKDKAIQKLVNKQNKLEAFERYYPKTVEEYTGYMATPEPETSVPFLVNKPRVNKLQAPVVLTKISQKKFHQGKDVRGGELRGDVADAYKLQKLSSIKGSPLSLAHYTRDPDLQLPHEQFDSHPKYTFSYGVHDAETGDSKSAQESRDRDGSVRGYYTFLDADGKLRTVRYVADDERGFRATVERS